jgi:hypothetical protein
MLTQMAKTKRRMLRRRTRSTLKLETPAPVPDVGAPNGRQCGLPLAKLNEQNKLRYILNLPSTLFTRGRAQGMGH